MKLSFLKTAISQTTNNIDSETGEVLNQDIINHTYIANAREEFILVYSSISDIVKHLTGPAIKTYFYLLDKYKPGTLIAINRALKEDIRETISSKAVGTISNCISELTSSNLLIKKKNTQGGYFINPRFAFKGSSVNRNKSLKYIIEEVCDTA